MRESVIIVGGGAAGLIAALELAQRRVPVVLLEARERLGGRIQTVHPGDFSLPIEAGAEFVHGDLPLTGALVRAAGLTLQPTGGHFYRSHDGALDGAYNRARGWAGLMRRMKAQRKDIPVGAFLDRHFPGPAHEVLRRSVIGFAEGYDLADIRNASTRSLYREWSGREGGQYRIREGYGALVDYLAGHIRDLGGAVHTGMPVRLIRWRPQDVEVHAVDGTVFTGTRVVVAVPLGVLQAGTSLRIEPLPNLIHQAFQVLGNGYVVKVHLEFDAPFWSPVAPDLGFVTGDAPIPTFWSQAPAEVPLLAGWFGGPGAKDLPAVDSAHMRDLALRSLARIFSVQRERLDPALRAIHLTDWNHDPYSMGGYSYEVVDGAGARAAVNTPVEHTLFFAGEAFYDGKHTFGTVEAALSNGREAARRLGAML